MPRHIGIVGCSAEGAALCYRTICLEAAEHLGAYAHPEVSTHTHPLALYVERLEAGDMAGVGELMLSSAWKLESIGAEILICPDNTIHQAFSHVAGRGAAAWLNIAYVVAASAAGRGFRRVGILGTRWLVDSNVYPAALCAAGLDFQRPSTRDRAEVHRIIMDELVHGVQRPQSVAALGGVVARLAAGGCDAVVLGCTELPLVLHDGNLPLPALDSTRLLARAALRASLQDGDAAQDRPATGRPQ